MREMNLKSIGLEQGLMSLLIISFAGVFTRNPPANNNKTEAAVLGERLPRTQLTACKATVKEGSIVFFS